VDSSVVVVVDGTAMPTNTVSGFASTDVIDLADVAFVAGASATLIETVSGTADLIRGGAIVSGSHLAVVSASTLTLSGGSVGNRVCSTAVDRAGRNASDALRAAAEDGGTAGIAGKRLFAAAADRRGDGRAAHLDELHAAAGDDRAASKPAEIDKLLARAAHGGADRNSAGEDFLLAEPGERVTLSGSGTFELTDGSATVTGGGFTGSVTVDQGATLQLAGGALAGSRAVVLTRGATLEFASGGAGIHLHYAPRAGSGTLTVSSGSTPVAQINIIGTYTSANFSAGADSQGNVKIFDPVVPNGGTAEPFPQQGVDLPNIAFGAQTTLAYAANANGNGGTLTVSDGRHAASIALLGNYMAGSFAVTADGHGGTLLTEASQNAPMLLAQPRHG
jgi:hypothetical protein